MVESRVASETTVRSQAEIVREIETAGYLQINPHELDLPRGIEFPVGARVFALGEKAYAVSFDGQVGWQQSEPPGDICPAESAIKNLVVRMNRAASLKKIRHGERLRKEFIVKDNIKLLQV